MFKYPYETTPCSSYQLKEIVSSLQHAVVNGELGTAKTLKNTPVEGLREVPPYLKAVPPFSHPLAFDHFGKQQLVIDVRPFVSQLRSDNSIRITNPGEYQFMVLRGMLTQGWARGDQSDFATFGDIAPRVFIRLLSEGIMRRLSLSPMNQQDLAIVTGYYFFCMFKSDDHFEDREVLKIAARISRITAINVEKILQVIEPLSVLKNVHDYCNTIKVAIDSPRTQDINPGMLYAIVGGAWFGAAAREIMAVAIEYPPYLYALIYLSVNDRGFRNAYFSKLVEAVAKGNSGKDFSNNLVAYLETLTHV